MRKEFLLDMKGGKKAVLYAGLLDLAHQNGLKSIRTELLQLPTADNSYTAICFATVTLEKDGREMVFTGVGDANTANVKPTMQTCLLRMAETRSKARALRDALNVGMIAIEEMSGEEEATQTTKAPMVQREGGILPSQKSRLEFLYKGLGEDVPGGLENLTRIRAEQIINEKQKMLSDGRAA